MSVDYQGMNIYLHENPPTYSIPSSGRSAYEHLLSADPLEKLSKLLVRGTPTSVIMDEMSHLLTNPALLNDLILLMFKTRDVRGAGERLQYRQMFNCIYATRPAAIFNVLDLVPQ